jgi:hypothetical protein
MVTRPADLRTTRLRREPVMFAYWSAALRSGTHSARQCSMATEDLTGPDAACNHAGSYGEVTISMRPAAQSLGMAAEVETLKVGLAATAVREVAGLGTSTYLLDFRDSGAQVHVIRGEHDHLTSVRGF